MTIPQWAVSALIGLAGLAVAALGFFFGRRKDREGKIEREASERTLLKAAIEEQTRKLDSMDRNINDKLSRMEGQYANHDSQIRDHEGRIVRLEESTKSAHRRIDEIKKEE
jgi:uncharacterized protein HemX